MKPRRSWWLIYAGCAAAVLSALAVVTVVVLRLERAEIKARTEAAHQEALRLALWRMDSWLAPLLAREAARPYFDYQPFYTPQRAYTALLRPIEQGEVLTPSPLLSFESSYFPLHFQMDPSGRLTSPQAPAGQFRALAEGAYLSEDRLEFNDTELASIGNLISREEVASCVEAAGASPESAVIPLLPVQADEGLAQQFRNQQEAFNRKGVSQQALKQLPPAAGDSSVAVGALVPFWSDQTGSGARLIFTRPVRIGDEEYYQGFVGDWPRLREALLEQIRDLFAEAELVPVRGAAASEGSGTMLATIPAALAVPAPTPASAGLLSPVRSSLAITWAAALAGLGAIAVTLRASIAFGERRSRFASAVTHELRTPLTTFRMYSEMLAEGMVEDPQRRLEYLQTLRDESGRLSNLVENVLAYARLEEGRSRGTPVATAVGPMLDRVAAPLRKRAEIAGMSLSLENGAPHATPITIDVEAVGQILYNLVDNACKYAKGAGDPTVHVAAATEDGQLTIAVRDHGPGVPAEASASIFEPFDRGTRNQGDGTPGVGLGLALARGLARDLGGDLRLRNDTARGACFELTIPLA